MVCAIDLPGLQLDKVRTLQLQDPSLENITDYLETGVIPTDSTSARRVMATIEDYVLEDGGIVPWKFEGVTCKCRPLHSHLQI